MIGLEIRYFVYPPPVKIRRPQPEFRADTLIVRMSLIRDAYRAEILGGLADAGEEADSRRATSLLTVMRTHYHCGVRTHCH
jgi:hypothetical protein